MNEHEKDKPNLKRTKGVFKTNTLKWAAYSSDASTTLGRRQFHIWPTDVREHFQV